MAGFFGDSSHGEGVGEGEGWSSLVHPPPCLCKVGAKCGVGSGWVGRVGVGGHPGLGANGDRLSPPNLCQLASQPALQGGAVWCGGAHSEGSGSQR